MRRCLPDLKGRGLHAANLMRWSVGIAVQGNRVLTREQVVELADAVAPLVAASRPGSARTGTARSWSWKPTAARRRRGRQPAEFWRAVLQKARLPAGSGPTDRGDQRGRRGRPRMIRLGSLAGYPFEGPAACWAGGLPRPRRRCTRLPTSRSRTPSRTSTRSSTWATPTT